MNIQILATTHGKHGTLSKQRKRKVLLKRTNKIICVFLVHFEGEMQM